jgi:hypothetical protein
VPPKPAFPDPHLSEPWAGQSVLRCPIHEDPPHFHYGLLVAAPFSTRIIVQALPSKALDNSAPVLLPQTQETKTPAPLPQTQETKTPTLLPQAQGSRPQPPPSDPGVQVPASSLRPSGPEPSSPPSDPEDQDPSLLPQTQGSRPSLLPQTQGSQPQFFHTWSPSIEPLLSLTSGVQDSSLSSLSLSVQPLRPSTHTPRCFSGSGAGEEAGRGAGPAS